MPKKNLLLTDNKILFDRFLILLDDLGLSLDLFDFAHSPNNMQFDENRELLVIKIKEEVDNLIDKYDKIFSLHSKQLFPKKLVESKVCINIHPGYNPYNRG